MGPRFVNRGCGFELDRAGSSVVLQWGRGLLTADAVLAFLICWIPFVLQWGRGLLTADAMSGRA